MGADLGNGMETIRIRGESWDDLDRLIANAKKMGGVPIGKKTPEYYKGGAPDPYPHHVWQDVLIYREHVLMDEQVTPLNAGQKAKIKEILGLE